MDEYKIRSFFKLIKYDKQLLENIYTLLKKYDQQDRLEIFDKLIFKNPNIESLKDVKSIETFKEIIGTIKYREPC